MRQGTMGLSSFDSRVSWTHLLFTRCFFHLKSHRIPAYLQQPMGQACATNSFTIHPLGALTVRQPMMHPPFQYGVRSFQLLLNGC